MITFGNRLTLWLDYLGIGQGEFAKLTGQSAVYYSSLRRGANRTTKPTEATQKKIYAGLKKALKNFTGQDQPMTAQIFRKGPPRPEYQPTSEEARDILAKMDAEGYGTNGDAPNDLAQLIRRASTFEGRELTDAKRARILKTIALLLDDSE